MTPQVVVSVPWLVVSHLAACALGAGMMYLVTLRVGESVHPTQRGQHMTSHRFRAVTLILVALLVLIGIAVQSLLYQRAQHQADLVQEKRDACISQWGAQFSESLDARAEQTKRLDAARDRRDKANAQVLLTVLALSRDGDSDSERFLRSLDRFARASAMFDQVARETAQVRADNPYPKAPNLVCGD